MTNSEKPRQSKRIIGREPRQTQPLVEGQVQEVRVRVIGTANRFNEFVKRESISWRNQSQKNKKERVELALLAIQFLGNKIRTRFEYDRVSMHRASHPAVISDEELLDIAAEYAENMWLIELAKIERAFGQDATKVALDFARQKDPAIPRDERG